MVKMLIMEQSLLVHAAKKDDDKVLSMEIKCVPPGW